MEKHSVLFGKYLVLSALLFLALPCSAYILHTGRYDTWQQSFEGASGHEEDWRCDFPAYCFNEFDLEAHGGTEPMHYVHCGSTCFTGVDMLDNCSSENPETYSEDWPKLPWSYEYEDNYGVETYEKMMFMRIGGFYCWFKLNLEERTAMLMPNGFINAPSTAQSKDYYYSDFTGDVVVPEKITITDHPTHYGWEVNGDYTVTEIYDMTFVNAGNTTGVDGGSTLTSVTLPKTIKRIGNYAFAGCDNPNFKVFTSGSSYEHTVYIHAFNNGTTSNGSSEGWVSFGEGVFAGCSSLTKVILPHLGSDIHNVKIPAAMFADCASLTSFHYSEDSYGVNGNMQSFFGTTWGYYTMKEIGEAAFAGCTSLKFNPENDNHRTMFYSLKKLGDYAFYASGIYSFVLNSSDLTVVPEGCFEDSQIWEFTTMPAQSRLDNSLTTEQKGYFHESKITEFGNWAFRNCKKLYICNYMKMSSGFQGSVYHIKKIGPECFKNDVKLANFTLHEDYNTRYDENKVPYGVFDGCTSITAVTLPYGSDIGRFAFRNCSKLTRIEISSNLGDIGEEAFYNCSLLRKIGRSTDDDCLTLDNRHVIEEYAFYNCTNLPMDLDYLYMNSINPTSGYIDVGMWGKVHPKIGSSSNVADFTFYNCSKAEISQLNEVQSVGTGAFWGVKVKESTVDGVTRHCLYLPVLTRIGDQAFANMQDCDYVKMGDNATHSANIPTLAISSHSAGHGTVYHYLNFTDKTKVIVPLRQMAAYRDKVDDNGEHPYWTHLNSNGILNSNWQLVSEVTPKSKYNYWLPIYADVALSLPESNMWAYAVLKGTKYFNLTAKRFAASASATANADVVPANTPVMLHGNSETLKYLTAYNQQYINSNSSDFPTTTCYQRTAPNGNMLRGKLDPEMITKETGSGHWRYFKWTTKNGANPGFYFGAADGAPFKLYDYNKAYLALNDDEVADLRAKTDIFFDVDDTMWDPQAETATGVIDIPSAEDQSTRDRISTLSGQLVDPSQLHFGQIYIRNGKKFIYK